MDRIFSVLRNKYLIATVAFIAWMLFFDRNDFMSQYEYQTQLNKLEKEKEFYLKETEQVRSDLEGLTFNKEKLEKLAREKYLMKRENEDVFVIVKEEQKKEKSLF
ncbi:MAG TPA: septum formation initiator family protein [Sphingobacteriaceae bacterium]|nr:septum formation initiator family protein [Sphingobacteriaceae bacterium]